MYTNEQLYDWLQEHCCTVAPVTAGIYDQTYREFSAFRGTAPMADVSDPDAISYQNHLLSSSLSKATVRKKIRTLSVIYSVFARKTRNSVERIHNPFLYMMNEMDEHITRANLIPAETFGRLYTATDNEPNLRLALLCSFRLYLSNREIFSLKRSDVFSREGRWFVSVSVPSNHKRRGIVIPKDCERDFLASVQELTIAYPHEVLLLTEGRGRIAQQTWSRRMRDLCIKAGVERTSLHALRNAGIAICKEPNKGIVAASCGAVTDLHPDRFEEIPEVLYFTSDKGAWRIPNKG